MKKIVSLLISGIIMFTMINPVFAEIQVGETIPIVYVNDRKISFKDQTPIIDVSVNRTLVPLRGVFEAMGAGIIWNDETRTVIIDSKDNLTRLVLEINNPVMKVYHAISLTQYKQSEFELETAPIILNNRTMIPLRAISENMEADVEWDGDIHTVTIHTKEYKKLIAKKTEENKGEDEDYVYDLKNDVINLSISADKEEVEAGEDVVISLDVKNSEILDDALVSGVVATVYYDSKKFAFGKAQILSEDGVIDTTLGASNGEFMNDSVKAAILVVPGADEIKLKDTAVLQITFTSLTGEEGEFILSDRQTYIGYDTGLLLKVDGKDTMYEDYTKLFIDTTPVIVK